MGKLFRKASIIFCFTSIVIFTGNDEELFLRGNKLYEHHEYDKALALYEMITHKGRAVLYNMGNCYYQKKDYPQAIVYWSKAERGARSQEYVAIQHNKEQALKKIGKEKCFSARNNAWSMIDGASIYFPLLLLQLFFLLVWYLLIGVVYKHGRTKKFLIGFLFIIVLGCASMLAVRYVKQSSVCAIVIKKDASLYIGPSDAFDTLTCLDYADNVQIREEREGWYKVRYSDKIGWVKSDSVQII